MAAYVGDAATSRAITGLGFNPRFSLVWKQKCNQIYVHV